MLAVLSNGLLENESVRLQVPTYVMGPSRNLYLSVVGPEGVRVLSSGKSTIRC